jgi:hypothetical protein
MSDFAVKFIQYTNLSPLFKGASVTAVGLCALLFALWMRWRWQEPLRPGFLVFIGVTLFIILFGLFGLIFQPPWWQLPY